MRHFLKSKVVVMMLLFVIVTVNWSIHVSAESEAQGSITLSYVVSDTSFKLYQVGYVDESNGCHLSEEFSKYAVNLGNVNAAQTLASYIARDNIEAIQENVTDNSKKVYFGELTDAVYLIVGQQTSVDGTIFTPYPMLIQIPCEINDVIYYDVNAEVKYEKEAISETKTISVLKLWKDDEKDLRPDEIEVQLLKDGSVYEGVKLNSANNWQYQWNGLPGEYQWNVLEDDIAEGYEVDIQKDGNLYVITNTQKILEAPENPDDTNDSEKPENPENPEDSTEPENPNKPESDSNDTQKEEKLPQTGQLWWPVPILVVLGMVCLILGIAHKDEEYEE